MKNTNKHLDDLFAAARREEPIISEENARELLVKNEPMQASPFIFSTKGIIMTTIGLSLTAFTAYIMLSGSPQAPLTHTTSVPATSLFTHSTNSNTDEQKKSDAKAEMNTTIATKANDEVLPPPLTPPLPRIPPLPSLPRIISTPVKIIGIKPMALAPEKYAKMGVSKREDGTVTFSQKNENGKIFSMSFPKNTWGITIGDQDQNEITDAPHFAPLIVTDTKGNKRMMQFTSDMNGKKLRTLEIQSRAEDENIDPQKITDLVNNALKIEGMMQMGGKDGDIDQLRIGLDSNDMKELHNAISIETNVENNSDTSLHGEKHITKGTRVTINNNRREVDTTINGMHKKMIVMNINKHISIDSTMKAAHESIKQAEKELKNVMKRLHLENLDTSKVKINVQELEKELDEVNTDEISKDNYTDPLHDILELENQSNQLNDLVPILVRTATSEHFNQEEGITFDDGLIFWYKPGKDLFVTVPEAQSSVTSSQSITSGIISKAVLYPNPAKTKTSLHFDLSQPGTIAFSIHDLLGKRVLDAGSIRETSAGSFEKELNVSELTAGVYLLVITTDKGEQSMQRLVIEK